MISITKRITFCAAHRLLNHEGACAQLHGHNYAVLVTVVADDKATLDKVGRVVDFSVVKARLAGFFQKHFDHGVLCSDQDERLIELVERYREQAHEDAGVSEAPDRLFGKPLYLFNGNPTAENMAEHILNDVCPAVFGDIPVKATKVIVFETETSSAEATC